MKRRLVKKWIKRYINPFIKDLPNTDSYATKITTGYMKYEVCQRQHVIVNGFTKGEGERYRINAGIRTSIIQTGKLIEDIIDHHRYVLVRCDPIVRGKQLYTRLITE